MTRRTAPPDGLDAVRLIMARARAKAAVVKMLAAIEQDEPPATMDDARELLSTGNARRLTAQWMRMRLLAGHAMIEGVRAAYYQTLAAWARELIEDAVSEARIDLHDAQRALLDIAYDEQCTAFLWGHGITTHWGSPRVVSLKGLGYAVEEAAEQPKEMSK